MANKKSAMFVIQKHKATNLHYDFRIEVGNTLKSWALPKAPLKSSRQKRLAIQTPDHKKSYASFEGTIPEGHYGAGEVSIWDKGTYTNLKTLKNGKEKSMRSCLKDGEIAISLSGKKLGGNYALIRMKNKQWLFFKMQKQTPSA